MEPIKETAEWSRRQTEERIVGALKEAEYQTEDGGLTFGEIQVSTRASSKTISGGLKRLRAKKAIDVRPVKRAKRYTTLYFLTKHAERIFPQVGMALIHYQELANTVYHNMRPGQFVSAVEAAIARDLIENWLVAKKGGKDLDFPTVQGLILQLGFLIKAYVFYRKNKGVIDRLSGKLTDTLNETVKVLRDVHQVDQNPKQFNREFDELIGAIRGGARK